MIASRYPLRRETERAVPTTAVLGGIAGLCGGRCPIAGCGQRPRVVSGQSLLHDFDNGAVEQDSSPPLRHLSLLLNRVDLRVAGHQHRFHSRLPG